MVCDKQGLVMGSWDSISSSAGTAVDAGGGNRRMLLLLVLVVVAVVRGVTGGDGCRHYGGV